MACLIQIGLMLKNTNNPLLEVCLNFRLMGKFKY